MKKIKNPNKMVNGKNTFYYKYPQSKIATPNIDKLAAEGMRFTDMHAPSSVCTPSLYGILTGNYCFRSRLPQGAISGYRRALILPGQATVASLLKKHDYYTGIIGKWRLGLDWVIKPGHESALQIPGGASSNVQMVRDRNTGDIDFTKPPTDGPLKHGFDYSYILPASLDIGPYGYLKNDTLTEPLTENTKGNQLNTPGSPNYATGAFWRPGPMSQALILIMYCRILPTKPFLKLKIKQKMRGPIFFILLCPHLILPGFRQKNLLENQKRAFMATM
ncbi:MAG: sulfatase-like hydrolase/transferase [Ginsengibacter sp.]